jgi:hypothetical protein
MVMKHRTRSEDAEIDLLIDGADPDVLSPALRVVRERLTDARQGAPRAPFIAVLRSSPAHQRRDAYARTARPYRPAPLRSLSAAAAHVTVVASSGDNGAASDDRFGGKPVKEVSLPSSDPLVLGVGGTTLTANLSTGAYVSETAWPGGGGFSHLYARPAYQDGVPGIANTRGVPDVAGDADMQDGPATVFAGGSIVTNGGTSNSAPLWGGLVALADQYAGHDVGSVNPLIYRIGRSASYRKAFHDITAGSNTATTGLGGCYVTCPVAPVTITGYQAAPGWDPVTGWGSPKAQALVPLLASTTNSRTLETAEAGAGAGRVQIDNVQTNNRRKRPDSNRRSPA